MDQATTVIAVVLSAAFFMIVIGMMVSQARHKALEAKVQRLRALSQQKKRLNNLLRSLPPSYMSIEIRDFLYQAIIQNLRTQLTLTPEKNELINSELEDLIQERERVREQPIPKNTDLLSADQASIYRGLLKSLYQFIRGNYETGRLKKDHAEKMIKQIEIKLVETAVDFFAITAKDFASQKRYREAKNAYQKALSTIGESKYQDQFKQQDMKLRNDLNRVIAQWRESREEASKASSTKLAESMENLVEDQESWKKKHDYE